MFLRPAGAPTPAQVAAARGVAKWYLDRYHGTAEDVGVVTMFADPAKVVAFASTLEAIRAGEPQALFRLLIATTMYQRRQYLQIMRMLQGISAQDAAELTDSAGVRRAAQACGCPHAESLAGLVSACDLHKDDAELGACAAASAVRCLPKRHAVLLKRYGHFGKVPTGLAHAVVEAGADDLRALKDRCRAEPAGPAEAAESLEAAPCRAWRVSDKIAAMFLSMLSNLDLTPGLAPWSAGLEWGRWVVIDSNSVTYCRASATAGSKSTRRGGHSSRLWPLRSTSHRSNRACGRTNRGCFSRPYNCSRSSRTGGPLSEIAAERTGRAGGARRR